MSKDLVFIRPIEKVATVYDLLATCDHAFFPVVDTEDRDILYGTVSRHILTTLLQQRAIGVAANPSASPNRNIVLIFIDFISLRLQHSLNTDSRKN